MSTRKCPSPDDLSSYLLGTLPEVQVDQIAEHVEQCDPCEATVARLESKSDTFVGELKKPIPGDAYADEPQRAAAIRLAAEVGREPSLATHEAAAAAAAEPLGTIRDYKLLAKLGEGGMGAVYKALHTQLDKVVALKVLPSDRLKDKQAIGRFRREMKAVGKLEHPNIVRATDAGQHDGTHYLVMELVEGDDLSALVRRHGSLPIADACELIRQAAVGLQYAHENGLVHRDIKPGNLMLAVSDQPSAISQTNSAIRNSQSEIVKILDMGLALLSEAHTPDGEGLTTTGQMMGTLDYMAPEQGDDTHAVDIRADIYSLGATLYKLLCGEAPFAGKKYDTPVKKLMALAVEKPPSIAGRRKGLPAELVAVVHKMLAKQPDDRYASPAEVAAALTPFAAGANLAALLTDASAEAAESVSAAGTDAPVVVGSDPVVGGSAFVAGGSPDPTTPPTEGLQEARVERRSGRPAVGQVSRSGDRATASGDRATTGADRATTRPAPSPHRGEGWGEGRWWINYRNQIVAVAAGMAGFILLGILLTIITGDGTIVVETPHGKLPDDVRVVLKGDGEPVEISADDKWTMTVSPGDYNVQVEGGSDEFAFADGTITVSRLGKNILTVTRKSADAKTVAKTDSASPADKPSASPQLQRTTDEPRATDAELLQRLGDIDWTPGEPARIRGYATRPTKLPGIETDWQIVPRLPHAPFPFPNDVIVSPRGNYLAVGANRIIRIVERVSGRVIGTVYQSGVEVSWSPDEKRIIIWQADSVDVARVCRLDGFVEAQWQPAFNNFGGMHVEWSPDGSRILFYNATGMAQYTPEGKRIESFVPPNGLGEELKCRWSPDGKRIAVGSKEGIVRVYSADGGQPLATFKDEKVAISVRGWHPDGTKVVTSGKAHWERLWTLSGEFLDYECGYHSSSVALSPDGRFFLTTRGSILDFDNNAISQLRFTRPIDDLYHHGIGKFVARWIEDDRIVLISTEYPGYSVEYSRTGEKLVEYDHPAPLGQRSLSWSGDQDRMVSLTGTGLCAEPSRQFTWGFSPTGDSSEILDNAMDGSAAFSPDGKRFAAQIRFGPLAIYDRDAKLLYRLPRSFHRYSWSPNGDLLATADGTSFDIWRGEKKIASLAGENNRVDGLVWNPSGSHLASWNADRDVFLWRLSTPDSPVAEIKGIAGGCFPNWSPDGQRLAVFTEDVLQFLSPDGQAVGRIPWKAENVSLILWRPDSQAFVVKNAIYNLDGKKIGFVGSEDGGSDFRWWCANGCAVGASDNAVTIWDSGNQEQEQIVFPGNSSIASWYFFETNIRGLNAQRVSGSGRYFAHYATSCVGISGFQGCVTYDVALIDIHERRHLWTGVGYSDGAQIRVEPTGRVPDPPNEFDRYLTYIIRYPTGRMLPLTRLQFAARIGLSPGQQFVQRMLDFGIPVQVAGGNEPLTVADVPDARYLPVLHDVIGVSLAKNVYVDPTALAGLEELTELESLDLSGMKIGNQEVAYLKDFTNLKSLNLSQTKVTDAVIGSLLPPHLEELELSHTAVGDFCLQDLRRFKSLRRLNVTGAKVTDQGIAVFQKAVPDCEVIR